ncbi:MAG: DUF5522 domain-containing protein [Puia sp.]|nr:DUF5522 domain-containing protein [Puia sp.]
MKPDWVEGDDFYYNEDGYLVLTEKYHFKKGFCCGNGCRHCPYDYKQVPEPRRTLLLRQRVIGKRDKYGYPKK